AGTPPAPAIEPARRRLAFDFFPGYPDLASFPRAAWLRAMREALRSAPDRAFGYPEPTGAPELRTALAAHLRRVRGVEADPRAIVITAGAAQGFALLAQVLGASPGHGSSPLQAHPSRRRQASAAAGGGPGGELRVAVED